MFLDGDDPAELARKPGEADFVVTPVFTAEHLAPAPKLKLIQHSGVIDEKTFYRALKNRRIAGAGIDVFEREPTPSYNPLLKPDHVLLTPHTAGATRDGMRKKARAQYENIRRVADGRPPINVTQPYSKVGAEAKA